MLTSHFWANLVSVFLSFPDVAEIHFRCAVEDLHIFVFLRVFLCTALIWGMSVTFSLHPAPHHQLHVLFPLPLPQHTQLNSFSATLCTALRGLQWKGTG